MSKRLNFTNEDVGCHNDDQDVSCSRCRHQIAGSRRNAMMLEESGRPVTDTCMLLPGLHIHPMNRTRFTCMHFEPRLTML